RRMNVSTEDEVAIANAKRQRAALLAEDPLQIGAPAYMRPDQRQDGYATAENEIDKLQALKRFGIQVKNDKVEIGGQEYDLARLRVHWRSERSPPLTNGAAGELQTDSLVIVDDAAKSGPVLLTKRKDYIGGRAPGRGDDGINGMRVVTEL